jgi:diguanylate cyclase (GGDEF)-like protein
VFRGRTAKEAAPYAEALRKAIADTRLDARTSDRSSIGVSVSIGISEKSKRHSTPELVVEAADKALYRAKEAGRNCVTLEEGAAVGN